MTIGELIAQLDQYGLYCRHGRETEVMAYVGMSKQVAEQRLKELNFDDEYVFDDFLDIKHLNIFEKDGFVYLRLDDIKAEGSEE